MVDADEIRHYENLDEAPEIYGMLNEDEKKVYANLNQDKIEQYYEIFAIFDQTGDGTIDNEEIGAVMQGLGQNPTPEKIESMVREIDYNGDGEVDF